jgi:ADP-heptose:LPS heptosyltransferase
LALREFIAAVTWCSGFIGGDSGPVHIAAALGVPTVALFGPTDPIRTGPLGSQVTVVRSPTGDMRDIPLEAVWAAAKTLGTKVGAGQCPSRSSS